MVLYAQRTPLRLEERPAPEPGPGQLLLRVHACAVCRTDLHIVDGELPRPKLPVILGHQIVATVEQDGTRFAAGERVGVPWLGWTDGTCRFCREGRENLCDAARFTGYDLDGGYAQRIGLYGFGAAAHLIAQVAVHQGRRVFAFTRPGDAEGQRFARELGAVWAGGSDEKPPEELDAALIFAPVGALIPAALRATTKGGTVVAGGIHMSDIPSFPYELLWGERSVRSVANLTRRDGEEFLALAAARQLRVETHRFPLEQANIALESLRKGKFRGAAVLVP